MVETTATFVRSQLHEATVLTAIGRYQFVASFVVSKMDKISSQIPNVVGRLVSFSLFSCSILQDEFGINCVVYLFLVCELQYHHIDIHLLKDYFMKRKTKIKHGKYIYL